MAAPMTAPMAAGEIDKIAVIGAGPGGLAAAKYLLAEKAFSEIVIFEQRLNVGGVWNATPGLAEDKSFAIPQTKPSATPNVPSWEHRIGRKSGKFDFLSPVYNTLETNIPFTLMSYSDQPFPEGCALFPRHEVMLEYLERYAEKIRYLIRFGTQVLDVHPIIQRGKRDKWSVTSLKLRTQEETTAIFDAVIVANGHYDTPFVPEMDGIEEWNRMYPGSISHSKFYRKPGDFKDKKILIVGNSASGTDIASQLLPHVVQPLLVSSRSPSQFPTSTTTSTPTSLPPIAQFLPDTHAIRFTNNHIEYHIDHILFCTGYLYSFPFLRRLPTPLTNPAGTRVTHLYQHLFYHPLPTLSFLALPQRIIPFPLSESQSSIIARVLSGRLALPSPASMQAWENQVIAHRGDGKEFHVLSFPLDADYINFLHAWSLRAEGKEGLENEGKGKIPPFWGEEERWLRERFPLIKVKARDLGEKRFELRSLEELGFDFGAWKREQEGRVRSRL